MKVFIRSTIALTLIAVIVVAVTFFRPTTISHAASADNILSQNYAGYADRNARFTTVTASWQVPSVKCKKNNQALAVWVGIGGLTKDNDLQQDGTLAVCSPDLQPQYTAFYEILPAAAQTPSLPMNPGDRISASVTFLGKGVFLFQIHDATQGWNFSQQGHKSHARLASAECIVEAPSDVNNHVLSLAKFSTVHISGCLDNGRPIGAGPSTTEIFMVSQSSGATKALPSGLSANGTAFSVAWERS